jgi:hydrogenase nickel insertion protein HypA
MHEYSMTKQMVDTVVASAELNHAKKVCDIYLSIGAFSFLNPEQIRFWFNLLKKESPLLVDSKLHIKPKKGLVHCGHCGYKGAIKYEDDPIYHIIFPTLECPKCKSMVTIVEGKEFKIENISAVV